MDTHEIIKWIIVVITFVLAAADNSKKKKAGRKDVLSKELFKNALSEMLSKQENRQPTPDEVREAEAILQHRGELLPNETMWQPDAAEERWQDTGQVPAENAAMQGTAAPDDMMFDEAAAQLRDVTHTAAYEAQRKREEAQTRAAEQAAYERAAKIPGTQGAPAMPRIQLTAQKAREAIVLATILGAPKANASHGSPIGGAGARKGD